MKRIFEEPTVCVERFTVTEPLTASWTPDLEDQTKPIDTDAIEGEAIG